MSSMPTEPLVIIGYTLYNRKMKESHKGFKITASLPFPLRLEGGPYSINCNHGSAELTFETVRQTTYDARLRIEVGEFDFEADRSGWASYSRVSSSIAPNSSIHPVTVLLECLNQVIRQLRDIMNCYWLYDLEPLDLYQVSIESDGKVSETSSFGRAGGITLPCTGISDEAEEKIKGRMEANEQVREWRLLQLNAEDSFALGKYEESILLGWGALETACRTETPRLARERGVTAIELAHMVSEDTPKHPPFSLEEVTENSYIRSLVRACCELAGTGYDSGSLAESVGNAQHLRNVIIHRGVRISKQQSRRALDDIGFILNGLRLPTSRPPEPFDLQTWVEHFGTASVDFPKLLDTDEGRLVVIRTKRKPMNDPLAYWFELERADDLFTVHVPEGIDEQVAAALVVVSNDSSRYDRRLFPHLVVRASDSLILSHLYTVAQSTTEAVHWAYASIPREQQGLAIQDACNYAINSIWKGFTSREQTIDESDARFVPLCARIASYLIHASEDAFRRFREKMTGSHGQISDEVLQLRDILTALNHDDAHSICDVLRAIHRRTLWLDSIVVRCPIEKAEYGTRKRGL